MSRQPTTIGTHRSILSPFTDKEWDILAQYCKKVGISKAKYFRRAILSQLEKDLLEMSSRSPLESRTGGLNDH